MGKIVSCKSEEGITIRLIDSLISISRVLCKRKFNTKQIVEALKDLGTDKDVEAIIRKAHNKCVCHTGFKVKCMKFNGVGRVRGVRKHYTRYTKI